MIEPTETESPQTMEALAQALLVIAGESGEAARDAPRTTPVRRVDEARAARRLVPTWDVSASDAGGDAPVQGGALLQGPVERPHDLSK
jgi:glycine cleavage system protein P-like pyridoxal-binding family